MRSYPTSQFPQHLPARGTFSFYWGSYWHDFRWHDEIIGHNAMPVPTSIVNLSICVLHYNRLDLTQECLRTIDRQRLPDQCQIEKLIIDNGSTYPHVPGVHTVPLGWICYSLPVNRGNIGGQNACFEHAQGEWILFIANDVRLTYDFLRDLWRERTIWGTVLQPFLLNAKGFPDNHGLWWVWPGYGISQKEVEDSTYTWTIDSFSSTCYLMHRWVWECLGGFDESLVSSHEDIDFSLRLRRMHGQVKRCYGAQAVHLGNATLRQTLSNPRHVFHQARLKVIRKHYSGLDYLTRYLAIQFLDHLPRFV